MTSILSWNVAGIRACIKKGGLDFLLVENHDIVCFQETKAEEHQVKLSFELKEKYPYRYWHATQGITQRKGLSGTSIWCKIEPIKVFENLYLIPSDVDIKKHNSEKIVGGSKLRKIRQNETIKTFDIVFIDTPPIVGMSDANIIAKEVDSSILVVQYRKYPLNMIRKAVETLQAQSIDIAGAVLNNINVMRDDYYYYYQSYYSDYYQRDDDDAEADLI